MLTLIVALSISASPVPVKLASPGLSGVQISKELTTYYSDHLAQLLHSDALAVMTATEISSLLGLERQKALIGCADEGNSCMAELANALGVDGIITGSIGKFGGLFQINLKVVAASDGRRLGIYSGTAETEGEVLGALKLAAASIGDQVLVSTGRARPASGGGARRLAWVPAALGLVGAGVGIGLFASVSGRVKALRGDSSGGSSLTQAEAQATLSAGNTERTLGIVSFVVGGVALLAAGAMFLFGAPVAVAPSVSVGSGGGAGLTFVGYWP